MIHEASKIPISLIQESDKEKIAEERKNIIRIKFRLKSLFESFPPGFKGIGVRKTDDFAILDSEKTSNYSSFMEDYINQVRQYKYIKFHLAQC